MGWNGKTERLFDNQTHKDLTFRLYLQMRLSIQLLRYMTELGEKKFIT